ncbi:DEAD/DEAH box helicase domain protein [Sphingobium chlorophenolicum L-1]|uniref:DEAD/DEAH box helicase domain protein n=1 Tax=Sphingobium chlorophenolicum L-1 TaxID=690566 RepID=F6EYC2_SPHCR|nr:DEAD/DEAH box helicase [Sphingobium chlorophenolicum]AEG50075.1 DEAD/DEAH box helicase domain protein [Sphingobium chlorophenolicum L-1]
MKSALPLDHGLSAHLLNNALLMPRQAGEPSITDAQYDALAAGVARGENMLVSAPTSTGKTLIGWWGVNAALAAGHRVVYLVSYRALAHQKFEEAQRLFLEAVLQGDRSSIVCATGDSVEDASGRKTSAPLSARILIATYEKFLGCLSTGGPPRDLTDICFVCDEIQLIGEKARGQNVELLLTLLKRSRWGQFIGLSAVLSESDAVALADWLELKLVRNPTREKTLTIECRAPDKTVCVTSAPARDPNWSEIPAPRQQQLSPLGIITEMAANAARRPVIAFCMKVDETLSLAGQIAAARPATRHVEVPAGLDLDETLLGFLRKGVAFHNAELSEEERLFVETRLANGEVDIVFATTTLAAGVNFPLGSAVFSAWQRWNRDRRRYEPISRAEFQNMAGRVGRMGQAGDGRVVLSANGVGELHAATRLMDLAGQDELGSGITPEDFGPLVLQILAGKLCNRRDEAFKLLASTLSAAREISRNTAGVAHWRPSLDAQVNRLLTLGCVIETGQLLTVTALGEAVARSGLKPETAIYFINNLARFGSALSNLLPSVNGGGNEDDLAFVLAHAALASPEYGLEGGRPTRVIHWRVTEPNLVSNPLARRLEPLLFAQPWMGNVGAANGAMLLADWFSGQPRQQIEDRVGSVRLGTVQTIGRDVAWILTGIAEIVSTITSPSLAEESKPEPIRDPIASQAVRRLARVIRRQAARISAGLPGDILWATSLDLQDRPRRLSRPQLLALRAKGLVRSIDLMDGAAPADTARREALDAVTNPRLANLVRDAARRWKLDEREYCKRVHLKRAAPIGGAEIIEALYDTRGDAFEAAFASLLDFLAIPYQRLDGPGKVGYPDFLVSIESFPGIVVELKTKVADNDVVPFNAATEVLSASELIGLRDHPCVTLCNPGVEPSVPRLIESCGRLCVLEACDLAEAALRLREGVLSRDAFYNWLTTPGIALREDLPHLR